MRTAAQGSAFLGRGWAFPPQFDRHTWETGMVEGDHDIRQSLELIFTIAPGEREMLPQFGCNLQQFVFAAIDSSVLTMIETEVRTALLNYEPRIDAEAVTVVPLRDPSPNGILITVDYTVRSSNRRYNIVYPYYLNEATGIPA